MVEYKTPGEIDAMHAAGQVVARILAAVRAQAVPGVRLAEPDETARDVLAEAGATSPFLAYRPVFARSPFPAAICASVNDAALHDIPGRYRLADGDLLSLDCGATLDGWAADAAISVQVGRGQPADTRLIAAATEALRAGIAAASPGGRLGDISAAIGAVGRAAGYGISTDFGGHGIRIDRNGWTIRSTDGSRAAHVEHTVAITDAGPRVLTSPVCAGRCVRQ